MSEHLDDRLADLLFGDVSAEERATMQAHLDDCARCADALAEATEAFGLLALSIAPETPPPALRARILAKVRPRPRLFLLDKVAQFYGLTAQAARALLDRLEDPQAWQPGPVARSFVLYVEEVGPRLAGAMCAFVRLEPDVRWPPHRHLGQEQMLVLEGGFREDDGHEVHAGQVRVMEKDTAHGFTSFAHEGCLSAAIVLEGFEFLAPLPPPD